MSVVFTGGLLHAARYTLSHAQLAGGIGTVVQLGTIPNGEVVSVTVIKNTAFNNSAAIRLNTTANSGENVATEAEVAAGTADTVEAAAWKTALQGLVNSGQRYLYARLGGGTPSAGSLTVIVAYHPIALGY